MPKKQVFEEFILTTKFKESTNNRVYNNNELIKIKELYDYIIEKGKKIYAYSQFTRLISYDLDNLIDRYEFLQKTKSIISKDTNIALYGKIEGTKRWEVYCNKQRVSNLYEAKKEKFGWTEEEFKEYNQSRAVTKEKCIERHGEEKGLEIWNNYVDRQIYTNTLEYFIEKYGENGEDKWLEYNKAKSNCKNIEFLMKKYNLNEKEALELLASKYKTSNVSLSELNFIEHFEKKLGSKVKYTANTLQYSIWNRYINRVCFYDLADSERNKIIEFNGDYWHCNPIKYDSNYYHKHVDMTAKEIWEHDYAKIKSALDRGFEVKIIWESDYINDPDSVIEEAIRWWNTK